MPKVLALDFDGVLRKWPGFITWYLKYREPGDLLARARLFWLRSLLLQVCIDYIPVILNGQLIEAIKKEKWERIILVSARCIERHQIQVLLSVSPYLKIDGFYFRENCEEPEAQFKCRILQREQVNLFIEDRRYVINYLRKRGLKTINIRELKSEDIKCVDTESSETGGKNVTN